MPKLLVFAGSIRRDSFNRKLAAVAAGMCRDLGAETTLLELVDHPLPLFSQDLETEEGLPANAVELKRLFQEHDEIGRAHV